MLFVNCETRVIMKPVVLTDVIAIFHETTTENKDDPLLSITLADWKASKKNST